MALSERNGSPMIRSSGYRAERQLFIALGATLALACATDHSDDEGTSNTGGECTANPAAALIITGTTEAASTLCHLIGRARPHG